MQCVQQRKDSMADPEHIVSDKVGRKAITSKLSSVFMPLGLEIYPFKLGWYNEQVDSPFKFDLHPDTLAYVIISTPDMFDLSLVPFMCRDDCVGALDILDKCLKHYFQLAKKLFPDEDIEVIHDFEMTPSRRPKILVQPAGHVAGAAYYYTRRALNPDPFEKEKKIFGICMHPRFGGWFALRGIFIFKSVQCPDLPYTEPIDCIPDQAKRVELLELFNYHWQDWRYRDIINVEKRYSEDQKRYFETQPKDRKPLIKELKEKFMKFSINPSLRKDTDGYYGSPGRHNIEGKCNSNKERLPEKKKTGEEYY